MFGNNLCCIVSGDGREKKINEERRDRSGASVFLIFLSAKIIMTVISLSLCCKLNVP
jgi:hypothetical protein